VLSSESLKKIDREVSKFPADQKQSAVMAALQIVQTEKGWLSADTMQEIASYLGMSPIAVYEVASFYTMYNLKPTGKYKLTVCTNLPCQLMGATTCAEHVKQKLGIGFNETTADGLFTLKEGECFGACGDAPVFTVNNHDIRLKITPSKFDAMVDELKSASGAV
jgi:NADH-quinone oxidoreductase subunit E